MAHAKGIIINNIIADLKKQSIDKIYATIIGFENPHTLGLKNSDSGYQPDVMGIFDNRIDLFSVETKIEKTVSKKDLERWRLFLMYAKANNGNLFLAGNAHNLSIIKQKIDPIPKHLKFIHLI